MLDPDPDPQHRTENCASAKHQIWSAYIPGR